MPTSGGGDRVEIEERADVDVLEPRRRIDEQPRAVRRREDERRRARRLGDLARRVAEVEALDLLEPALARAGRNLVSLAAADRNLDCLREDPRFERMLDAAMKRVGLEGPEVSPPAAT